MWVALLHCSVAVLIIVKVGLEKCQNVYQEQFHHHFNSEGHNVMEAWEITIIDRAKNVLDLRRRESYWQHRLNESFVGIHML